MEDRQKLLDEKTAELKKCLDSWAYETGIVRSGERLELTLKVRGYSVLRRKHEEQAHTLGMSPAEFFSLERLRRHGISYYIATNIHRYAQYGVTSVRLKGAEALWKTMREFMDEVSIKELSRTPNVGPMFIEHMGSVLGEAGLTLRDK